MKRLKRLFIITMVLVLAPATLSYASQKPVNQKAYYDTFIFQVNNKIPNISDVALKPFIANDRVYVPIRTLNDQGIANVRWTKSQGDIPAVLFVEPMGGTTTGGSQDKFEQLTKTNADLLSENKTLKEQVDTLKKENDALKKERKENEKDKKRDPDDRNTRDLVRDIERDLYRDRNYNEINIGGKYYEVTYQLDYRRDFDIDVIIKGLTTDGQKDLKKDQRKLEYVLEDVHNRVEDDFRDTRVYFSIYKDNKSEKNRIGSFDIDDRGRLGGRLD